MDGQRANVSVSICKAATWSSLSTFSKQYHLNLLFFRPILWVKGILCCVPSLRNMCLCNLSWVMVGGGGIITLTGNLDFLEPMIAPLTFPSFLLMGSQGVHQKKLILTIWATSLICKTPRKGRCSASLYLQVGGSLSVSLCLFVSVSRSRKLLVTVILSFSFKYI